MATQEIILWKVSRDSQQRFILQAYIQFYCLEKVHKNKQTYTVNGIVQQMEIQVSIPFDRMQTTLVNCFQLVVNFFFIDFTK